MSCNVERAGWLVRGTPPGGATSLFRPPRTSGFVLGYTGSQRTASGCTRFCCGRGARSITNACNAYAAMKAFECGFSRRQRTRVRSSTTRDGRLYTQFPNHVWALDFAFNQTAGGPVLQILTITDEVTKTTLKIQVDQSNTGDHLVRMLDR